MSNGYDSGYMNLSNRSYVALHIGQVSGGSSLAQRYPQTLHLQTGKGREPAPSGEPVYFDWMRSL